MDTIKADWAPRALSLLRIFAGLLFLEHGLGKLLGFPAGPGFAHLSPLFMAAGFIETIGGILVTLGLFTRPAAFILSGEMAIAYFYVFAPHSFFPAVNHGEAAIVFCFVFLYLAAQGGGPWSVDATRG